MDSFVQGCEVVGYLGGLGAIHWADGNRPPSLGLVSAPTLRYVNAQARSSLRLRQKATRFWLPLVDHGKHPLMRSQRISSLQSVGMLQARYGQIGRWLSRSRC